MIEREQLPDPIGPALNSPKRLLIWTGAGICTTSGFPMGDELVQHLITELFNPLSDNPRERLLENVPEKVRYAYRVLYPNDERQVPRLEFVLDVLERNLGADVRKRFMEVFSGGIPTIAHHAIAALNSVGANVVTANFDTLHELAGTQHPFHYHKVYDDLDCGAMLSRIAQGFDATTVNKLEYLLDNSDTVLFVGYSGRDFYDVVPFFLDRPARFKTAIWIKYKHDVPLSPVKLDAELKYIEATFKKVLCFKGDPTPIYGLILNCYPPTTTAGEKQCFNWRDHICNLLRSCPQPKLWAFRLDLLVRLSMDETAISVVDHIDEFAHTERWALPDRQRYEERALQALFQGGRFTTVIKRSKCFPGDPGDETCVYIQRRIEASCSGFGYKLLRLLRVLYRAKRAVAIPIDNLNSPESIHSVFEQAHTLYQVSKRLMSVRCCAAVTRKFPSIQKALRKRYAAILSVSQSPYRYDEYLAEQLRSRIDDGKTTKDAERSLIRCKETDDLKHMIIMQRWGFRTNGRDEDQPTLAKILAGISKLMVIENYYELYFWLILARKLYPQHKDFWQELEKRVFRQIEIGPIGRALFKRQVLGVVTSDLSKQDRLIKY